MRIVRLGIAVLALAACAREDGARVRADSAVAAQSGAAQSGAAQSGAAREAELADTVAWPQFTLRVPRGTRRKVSEECPGGRLVGPTAPDSSGRALPRFDLCVDSRVKPASQPLAAWVDSVRADRNRTLDSLARLDPPDTVTLGATPMLRLTPYCADCEAYEYYAAGRDRVVGFSFSTGPQLAHDRRGQEAEHLAILRTLRWR